LLVVEQELVVNIMEVVVVLEDIAQGQDFRYLDQQLIQL
jgi:hypothetical protein